MDKILFVFLLVSIAYVSCGIVQRGKINLSWLINWNTINVTFRKPFCYNKIPLQIPFNQNLFILKVF